MSFMMYYYMLLYFVVSGFILTNLWPFSILKGVLLAVWYEESSASYIALHFKNLKSTYKTFVEYRTAIDI